MIERAQSMSVAVGTAVGTGAALLLLGSLLVGTLVWRLSTLAPLAYTVADPALHADGFYPVEPGEGGVLFRWSRPSAGFLLSALAARQVVTLELSAPRPAGVAAPAGVRLTANGEVQPLAFAPGWATYPITATSQVGLENAVALTASTYEDSFYPGPSDSRHLMVAVRRVAVAPLPSLGDWPLPAPLPGALALLLPTLVGLLIRRWRESAAVWIAELATIALGTAIVVLPGQVLPTVLAGVGAVLVAGIALAYAGLLEEGLAWLLPDKPHDQRLRHLLYRAAPVSRLVGLGIIFTGLAVLATWPLATQLPTALPGWPGDNFAFLYKIWWVESALHTGANPFYDPHVFAPFGFNFGRGEPTLPNTLPGALVALGGSPVLGYNLVLLAGFVASGLGTYALTRAVGAARAAALLAGIILMLAPYRLAQAAGHLQIAATQWLPLTLFFAERTLQRRRRLDGALTGLCYGLAALTAWYYAIIGGLLLGGFVALRLLQMRRAFPWRRALAAGALFAVVAGVVVLPGLLPALGAAREASLSHSAKAADENSASPEDYLIPNQLQPLWGAAAMQAHSAQNIIEDALYPGLPALVLAGLALATRRTLGRAWIWVVLAAGCFVLSLGLTLHTATGGPALIGGQPVPLPARLLYDWVPGFSSLRAYARFGVGVALGVAVLAGLGLTALRDFGLGILDFGSRLRSGARSHAESRSLQNPKSPIQNTVVVVALGLVLLDFWSAPNAWGLTTVQPNAVAAWLTAQPPGAVMQLPLTSAIAGPPLYAGTAYGHPLAYGYETFEPPQFVAARPTLAGFPSPAAFALLRQWGVRYVVVAASSYGAAWAGTSAYFATLPDWSAAYQASQPVTWAAPFWVGEVRPELRDALAPDELVVYRLK